jgi:hypothetical protein
MYDMQYIYHTSIIMSVFRKTAADITVIDTEILNVNQGKTSLLWSATKRASGVSLAGGNATAKLRNGTAGTLGILGNTGYVIGTDTDKIEYNINSGSTMHVGIAQITRDLTSITPGSDLASLAITSVGNGTVLTMCITTTALIITYNSSTTSISLTGYTGLTMYPWLANADDGVGFSVSISKISALKISVDTNGDILFDTVDSSGMSQPIRFNTGSSTVSFSGAVGLSAPTQLDTVETTNPVTPLTLKVNGSANAIVIDTTGGLTMPGILTAPALESDGTDLLLSRQGGIAVSVDIAGNLTTTGVLTGGSAIANSLASVVGNNLQLGESTGLGLQVEDVTGIVSIDNELRVGDAAGVNAYSLASFGASTADKCIIVPSIANTAAIISTFPGMIALNTATGRFVGYTGTSWQELSLGP